jgi:hypothetical protein
MCRRLAVVVAPSVYRKERMEHTVITGWIADGRRSILALSGRNT